MIPALAIAGTVGFVVLAIFILGKECGWAKCADCGIFHHRNGRTSFDEPDDWSGERRPCEDCRARAARRNVGLLIWILILGNAAAIVSAGQYIRPPGNRIKAGHLISRSGAKPRISPDQKSEAMQRQSGSTFIDRIAAVESRRNELAIGDNGKARGAWQMTEAAWLDVSALRTRHGLPVFDWEAAHDFGIGREYALQYVGILDRQLRAALRRHPSEKELYCAFNLGLSGFRKRGFSISKCPASTRAAAGKLTK